MLADTLATPLAPLPYHQEVVRYLQAHEPELWQWARSAQARAEYGDSVRLQLLKETYRLEPDAHPEAAEACARVAERLGISAPVTLYQSGGSELNAMLCYLPGEAHVILAGPVLGTLSGQELQAVLAHELAHYRLWEMEDGCFHIADRLLTAVAVDDRAGASQLETARRYRLYTEIYADRGGLLGCGSLEATVAALVKMQTGLADVSAASYLRQAEEIFAKAGGRTEGLSHPEVFVRARALRLWAEQDATLGDWLPATIEGALALDDLDLPGQQRLLGLTRRFLAQLLRPRWFQSAPVLSHARQFFPDFEPAAADDHELIGALAAVDGSLREYLAYLLLDFAAVDRDLEELPLAAGLHWSERLGFADTFEALAAKDLALNKRRLSRLRKQAPELLNKAETAHG